MGIVKIWMGNGFTSLVYIMTVINWTRHSNNYGCNLPRVSPLSPLCTYKYIGHCNKSNSIPLIDIWSNSKGAGIGGKEKRKKLNFLLDY